jgi:hypothetical protein
MCYHVSRDRRLYALLCACVKPSALVYVYVCTYGGHRRMDRVACASSHARIIHHVVSCRIDPRTATIAPPHTHTGHRPAFTSTVAHNSCE